MQSKLWLVTVLLLAGCSEGEPQQDADPSSRAAETHVIDETDPLAPDRERTEADPHLKLQDPVAFD